MQSENNGLQEIKQLRVNMTFTEAGMNRSY